MIWLQRNFSCVADICSSRVADMSDPADFDAFDHQVATALARYNAAGAEVVAAIRRCLDEGWWEQSTNSPEHWVMARCGLDARRAHQLVRLARELTEFPATAAAFEAGQITEAHVGVIVGCDPAADRDLAVCAPACNVAQLRRIARAHPKPTPEPDPATSEEADQPAAPDEPAEPADSLAFWWNQTGRLQGRFDLGAAAGAVVEKALRAARSALFRARTGLDPEDTDDPRTPTERAISWADALERLGLAGLDGIDPETRQGRHPSDRYQVLLHLDGDHPDQCRLHLGPLLTAADRRLLTCDADLRTVLWRNGRPVNLGRRQRVVDPLLRALIEDRDGACRNCGALGFLHIHHLVHWTDGGPTDDDNLVALCTTCHRAVHHGKVRISGDPTRPDGLVFLDRWGRLLPTLGPLPPPEPPPPVQPYYGPVRGERFDYRYL